MRRIPSSILVTLFAAALSVGLLPPATRAAPPGGISSLPTGRWTENGIPLCTADGDQSQPDGAPDGAGGAFFAWSDPRLGLGSDIFAVHVTPKGDLAAGWAVQGNPICTASGIQGHPAVVTDGSGGAIVAWIDERDGATALYAQRLLSNGATAPGWPADGLRIADSVWNFVAPSMDDDEQGGALLAWQDMRLGYPRARVQRIDASGQPAPGWPTGGIDVSFQDGVGDYQVHVASDGAGGAYVAWEWSYWLQEYNITRPGAAIRHVGAVNWTYRGIVNGSPWKWSFAGDGPRGAFWGYGSGLWGISLARFGPDGSAVWSSQPSSLRALYYLNAAADGTGGVFLVTNDTVADNDFDVFALRLAADGSIAPGWIASGSPVCSAPNNQSTDADPVADGRGGAYFCWADQRGSDPDIYGSRMTANGVHSTGWSPAGNSICAAAGVQTEPRMFSDGLGGAMVVWRDERSGSADIYAQRIGMDYPVPTLISLVRADAEPDVVRLTWAAADRGMRSAVVQRREPVSDWRSTASLNEDAAGRFVHADREVTSGSRYGYRLSILERDGEQYFGETWLTVPSALELALDGVAGNPAIDHLVVSFSLASREPAALALFDLAGRPIASQDVSQMGPGRHRVTIAGRGRLRPGVYLVRLSQQDHQSTIKACVLR